MSVPVHELLLLAGLILVGGALSGFLAGIFGVGGGGIIVPVLYEIFRAMDVSEDVRMQLCVGTSLAIIGPTAVRAFFAHRAKGELPVEILRVWAVPIVIGVFAGGALAAVAPGWVFKLSFTVIIFLLSLKMLYGNQRWRLGDTLPGTTAMRVYGVLIGLYAALIGVGGGTMATIIMTLYGSPIHVAVGISTGVGVLVAAAGTLSFILAGLPHQAALPAFSIGFVSLIGFVLMAPVTTLAAPYGARISHRLSKRRLEIAFGIFLMIVAGRFVFSLL